MSEQKHTPGPRLRRPPRGRSSGLVVEIRLDRRSLEEAFLEALGRALEERGLWPEEAELYWGAGGEEWEDDEGAGVESAEVVVALDGEEIAAGQLDAEGAWEEDGLRVTCVQVRFDWVK